MTHLSMPRQWEKHYFLGHTGTLQKDKRSARQAFNFKKYTVIKKILKIKMAECILYTLMYRYVYKYYAKF